MFAKKFYRLPHQNVFSSVLGIFFGLIEGSLMIKRFLIVLFLLVTQIVQARSAVTYTFSGGRFGDNLLAYSRAKYISCLYDIPLLYIPFTYSDQLMMHNLEIQISHVNLKHFKDIVSYKDVNGKIDPNADLLYVIPFFPESVIERNCPRNPYLFDVDWNNPLFIGELKKTLKPNCVLNLLSTSHDGITVAVHVRIGSGFDILPGQTYNDMTCGQPLKWPPFSFYCDALRKIAAQYPEQAIYAYIFTDHDNPAEIMEWLRKEVGIDRVIFDCRVHDNKHNANVLEDFFSLLNFDCLIRGDSNFSIIAEKIHEYKVLIAPWHATQVNGQIMIDEIIFKLPKGEKQ